MRKECYFVYIHDMEDDMKFKKINQSQCHCITLRRASNAITEYYDVALQEVGLTTSQYSLLKNLGRLEMASTSELAEQVNLDRSTLVRNLKPLLERGLIVDLAKENARNHQFQVSETGMALLEEANPRWQKAQDGIKAYLGKENVEMLMEMLYRLQELNTE